MQAARLLPGSTRNAAEPTAAGPNAAAADENEDGRVCVGGLGPCAAVLLNARSEQQRTAACCCLLCSGCMHRVHHVQARPGDGTRLLIAHTHARPWHTPIGRGSRDPHVPAPRHTPNGRACTCPSAHAKRPWQPRPACTCHAVLWQQRSDSAQLLSGPTRHAAEPAVVCALPLLKARSQHQRPAAVHEVHAPRPARADTTG